MGIVKSVDMSLVKTAITLLAFASILLLEGFGAVNQENATGGETPVSAEQLAKAKVIFSERCVRCHGADGRGQTVIGEMIEPPDFTDEKWWKPEISNVELVEVIKNGKREMPAFGKKLTRQEINYLVAYVRRFNKTTAKPE